MKWIDRIRGRLSKKKYLQIEPVNGKYKRDFLNLDDAKRVGLIINMTKITPENHQQVLNFIKNLQQRKKEIYLIELNFQRKITPTLEGPYEHLFICSQDLDWLRFPQENIARQLHAYTLDVLLNLDQSNQVTSKYICGIMNAKTRIGIHEEGFEDCYEVMIDHQPVDQLQLLIDTFEGYLNMTKKQT